MCDFKENCLNYQKHDCPHLKINKRPDCFKNYNKKHQTEASSLSDLLDAAEVAKAALDNLANEFMKLNFDHYARSGKEYQKVIKGQLVIATEFLAKHGI